MKLKSVLLGAVTAGTITLFTTKYSGKERRELIKNYITETKNNAMRIKNAANNTKENLNNLKQLSDELLTPFISDLNEEIENFKFQLEPRVERLQESIDKLNNDLKNN